MPTKTEKDTRNAPPYISFATVRTLIDWLREMPVTPSQIDRSLWGRKFGGSTGPQLMGGLRFMGLLKENHPTGELEHIVRADPEPRRNAMRECLKRVYGDDLVENLATKTPKMVSDAIAALGATSATQRKAERFFIEAVKYAGVTIPDTIAKRSRTPRKSTGHRTTPANDGANDKSPRGKGKTGQNGNNAETNKRIVTLVSGGTVTLIPDVDWIHLSTADREFIFDMIDRMGLYEDSKEEAQ